VPPAKRSVVRNVFLSSTARDLGPYRDAVYKAISGLDGFHCVRMEDFGARDWAADDFCRARVAECDVFVGLIGHLYGSSPTGLKISYTESEYEAAVEKGLPRLLYFAADDLPMAPNLRERDVLWKRQQRFRKQVLSERVGAFFKDPDALATHVVTGLRNDEREKAQNAEISTADLTKATGVYLNYLVERYRYLDFKGFGVSDRVPLKLPLLEMYVPLKARVETPEGETWDRLRLAGRQPTKEETEALGVRISKPQPILDLMQKHNGLIVLGDPGSGKSTFLKFLALSLATGQGATLGLQGRLPVLLPLAAYANTIAENKEIRLDRFLSQYYDQRGVDVPMGEVLEQAFKSGSVLFLLDGLDEVRDTSLRNTVVERVRDCYTSHRATGNKFVITSRIVGYREVRPQAEGLAECTLVDFEDDEIQAFVEKWTEAIERAASGDTAVAAIEAKREREELLDAASRNPGVRSLAANPLLLTILAVMKRQGVTLPERRAALYQTYIETLLRNWNLVRSLDRSMRVLDVDLTLKVLAPLALWMHVTSPGVGLVREWDLHRELRRIYQEIGNDDPEDATKHFLEDVREHAALLLDRGGRQYGFIHLTFQEYLAAVALAQKGQQEIGPVVDALAAHVGEPAWHEVSLLTIGYLGIVQKRDEAASAVVQELIARAQSPPGEAVILAGRAVVDAGAAGVTPICREAVVKAFFPTMRAKDIKAQRRAAVGKVLADLGDPRPEVMTLDGMEFCLVPAGPFRMGSDKYEDERPEHQVEIPYDFFLARYSVTGAQFKEYLEVSGKEPGHPVILRGPANFPVVAVTWDEAQEFCAWLTDRWQKAHRLQGGWKAALPSEAEWEKAARGGLEILAKPQVGPLGRAVPAERLKTNPNSDRTYPWGDKADSEWVNYDDTGIGEPSTVGCFPRGASVYGCEEMSGNVWEWTRSLYESYPYPKPGKNRILREDFENDGLRVARGGAFGSSSRFVRCACRYWAYPGFRGDGVGFRVVLSRFSSDL
jgi:formylglycine-generating enzyme required for sulfatase activity